MLVLINTDKQQARAISADDAQGISKAVSAGFNQIFILEGAAECKKACQTKEKPTEKAAEKAAEKPVPKQEKPVIDETKQEPSLEAVFDDDDGEGDDAAAEIALSAAIKSLRVSIGKRVKACKFEAPAVAKMVSQLTSMRTKKYTELTMAEVEKFEGMLAKRFPLD